MSDKYVHHFRLDMYLNHLTVVARKRFNAIWKRRYGNWNHNSYRILFRELNVGKRNNYIIVDIKKSAKNGRISPDQWDIPLIRNVLSNTPKLGLKGRERVMFGKVCAIRNEWAHTSIDDGISFENFRSYCKPLFKILQFFGGRDTYGELITKMARITVHSLSHTIVPPLPVKLSDEENEYFLERLAHKATMDFLKENDSQSLEWINIALYRHSSGLDVSLRFGLHIRRSALYIIFDSFSNACADIECALKLRADYYRIYARQLESLDDRIIFRRNISLKEKFESCMKDPFNGLIELNKVNRPREFAVSPRLLMQLNPESLIYRMHILLLGLVRDRHRSICRGIYLNIVCMLYDVKTVTDRLIRESRI